jgi:hypothetical protein
MFGDGASLEVDPTEVEHHEALLELAESALDAAEARSMSSRPSRPRPSGSDIARLHETMEENPLRAVPALEVKIKLLGDRLRGGGVDVVARMPPGYPEFCRADIRAEGNARVTVDDLNRLRVAAESAVNAVEDGEESALSGVEAVRAAVAELAETPAALRMVSPDRVGRGSNPEAHPGTGDEEIAHREVVIARRLIWFHHIKAPGKRKAARQWAEELDLGGFAKPGYPGIIVIEGRAEDCDEYVTRLKQLTWKAMSVRVAEQEDRVEKEDRVEAKGRDAATTRTTVPRPGDRRLPASFEELPENGLGAMGEALRAAGLEHLLEAALKQRTI